MRFKETIEGGSEGVSCLVGYVQPSFHVYLLCVWQPGEAGITEIGKFYLKQNKIL